MEGIRLTIPTSVALEAPLYYKVKFEAYHDQGIK